MKFIKDCLESIFSQTVLLNPDYAIKMAVNVVDNGSQDETVEFIRKNYPQVHVLKNIKNLGFSSAYNQAIKMHTTDWNLIMNVDVILEPDFIEKLLAVAIKSKDNEGSFGGKILKVETKIENGGLQETVKSNKIDSYGLEIKKSRQFKNIGEGDFDGKQYDETHNVFGFSGACVLFKRETLESIKFRDEYFDEDFFMYQEDVDLTYRLQLYGWQSIFVPGAKCYHFRSTNIHTLNPRKFRKIIQARKSKSQFINHHSYKNHLFILLKNEIAENFYRHLSHIFWFEFKKFVYLMFFQFDFKTLSSLRQVFKLWRRMRIKRKIIMSRRKVTAEYMRNWMK